MKMDDWPTDISSQNIQKRGHNHRNRDRDLDFAGALPIPPGMRDRTGRLSKWPQDWVKAPTTEVTKRLPQLAPV